MKTSHLVLALVAIVLAVVCFELGRSSKPTMLPGKNVQDRLVTISVSPDSNTKCEVDYPVVFLRSNHRIQWASTDNKYWISFKTLDQTPPSYTPENPLSPADDPVIVDKNSPSRNYNVIPKDKYYVYAIYDHDPATNPAVCKSAVDDRDPGLDVKR